LIVRFTGIIHRYDSLFRMRDGETPAAVRAPDHDVILKNRCSGRYDLGGMRPDRGSGPNGNRGAMASRRIKPV
jgi:hypothetical protein